MPKWARSDPVTQFLGDVTWVAPRRYALPIEPNGVHPRTSLWSSRSLFPGKSDFGGQRQNGNNVRGGTVRESRDQVDPAEGANTGYLAPPPGNLCGASFIDGGM
jgi:hypothetical protein